MRLVTAAEMAKIDQLAIQKFNIPGIVLMENAGIQAVVRIITYLEGHVKGKRIVIFCGRGNNGGDGMVIARHLLNRGADVKVFFLSPLSEISGDALRNLKMLQQMQAKIYSILEEKDLHRVDVSMVYADVIVDAIYGTGFKGRPDGLVEKIIQRVNESRQRVFAIDVPSGLDGSTGKIAGACVRADETVTFGLPKVGLFLEPGCRYCGNIVCVDISLPRQLTENSGLTRELLNSAFVRRRLTKRDTNTHKGTYGHVLVLGGSPGMTGATALAAHGALTMGAGLVTAAVPKSLNIIMEQKLTEVMTKPLPETEKGLLSRDALESILEAAKKATAVVIGPGMGISVEGETLVKELLLTLEIPLVIDADALTLLAKIMEEDKEIFQKCKAKLVLTPHPGEMARLAKISVQEIQDNRLTAVERYAKQWGVTVILKGYRTLIANQQGHCYLNTTGNPGMATGGAGDVLAGMIASLLGQGMDVDEAAAVGVYLHGSAGDLAAKEKSEFGLTAMDLIAYLPKTILEIIEGEAVATRKSTD